MSSDDLAVRPKFVFVHMDMDEIPKPSRTINDSSLDINQKLISSSLCRQIREHAAPKPGSPNGRLEERYALLEDETNMYTTVLIGDTLMARFDNIGNTTSLSRLPHILNLGFNGDKIEHTLHRIDLNIWKSMMLRRGHNGVKIWILHIGTLHLKFTGALRRDHEVRQYEILVRALLEMGDEGCTVLCTSLFPRKDLPDTLVTASNAELQAIIETMKETHNERVRYLPTPKGFDKNKHLHDSVHLNRTGYALWNSQLAPLVKTILGVEQDKPTSKCGDVKPNKPARPSQTPGLKENKSTPKSGIAKSNKSAQPIQTPGKSMLNSGDTKHDEAAQTSRTPEGQSFIPPPNFQNLRRSS